MRHRILIISALGLSIGSLGRVFNDLGMNHIRVMALSQPFEALERASMADMIHAKPSYNRQNRDVWCGGSFDDRLVKARNLHYGAHMHLRQFPNRAHQPMPRAPKHA